MMVIESVLPTLSSIIKANFIIVGIVLVVYILEVVANLKIFIRYFTWKKSLNNARIAANGNSGYYFIACLFVYISDIYRGNVNANLISIIVWLVLMIVLTSFFHHYYNKYQGVNPTKADDDFL